MSFFAEVLLPLPFNEGFTYQATEGLKVGDVVKVSFRKKNLWGVVVKIGEEAPEKIDLKLIKPVIEKHQTLKLSQNILRFIEQMAEYYLVKKGLIIKAFLGVVNNDNLKKPKAIAENCDDKIAEINLSKLSQQQEDIFVKLQQFVAEKKYHVSLIDGVTGSGKTEIYFHLIADILKNSDEQILILLPEIALTNQLVSRFKNRFGFEPKLWHSKITPKQKREIFSNIADGSLRVLIGARSALLLPFAKLRLIIVDEEHDASFRQEEVFNFQARDMAILKAKIEDFSVILCSATPAVESYINAISGKYNYFNLNQKFHDRLNTVELIDLKLHKLKSGQFLSQILRDALVKNLNDGQQSLLFLNRRGYAPVTLCSACGNKVDCPNCSAHLVTHMTHNKMMCHYCGFEKTYSGDCAICSAENSLVNIGVGVERIYDELQQLLPQARIALVTSDNVANFKEAKELIRKITDHEIDVIVGTQLVAKGYDFVNLSLVGVVDADSGFYSSDFRSTEKSYQMLSQVIGRAGRKNHHGRILLQTYNPQNFVFEKIINSDYEGFYNFEISSRRSLELPPFSKMATFTISAKEEKEAIIFAKRLIAAFPVDEKIELLGPAPMPIVRLRNLYHYWVFLKVAKKVNLQKLINDVCGEIVVKGLVKLKIEIV